MLQFTGLSETAIYGDFVTPDRALNLDEQWSFKTDVTGLVCIESPNEKYVLYTTINELALLLEKWCELWETWNSKRNY